MFNNWNVVVIGMVWDELINLNVLNVMICLNFYFVFDNKVNSKFVLVVKLFDVIMVNIIVKINVFIVVLIIWCIGLLLNFEVIVGKNF